MSTGLRSITFCDGQFNGLCCPISNQLLEFYRRDKVSYAGKSDNNLDQHYETCLYAKFKS